MSSTSAANPEPSPIGGGRYRVEGTLGRNDRAEPGGGLRGARAQTKSGALRMAGARYERLAQRAQAPEASDAEPDEVTEIHAFTALLKRCRRPSERAHAGLEVLAQKSGAVGGVLCEKLEAGLTCSARAGELEPTIELETWVQDYFESECGGDAMTRTVFDAENPQRSSFIPAGLPRNTADSSSSPATYRRLTRDSCGVGQRRFLG